MKFTLEIVTDGHYKGWVRLPGGYVQSPDCKTILYPSNKAWEELPVKLYELADQPILSELELKALAVGMNMLAGARAVKAGIDAQRAMNEARAQTKILTIQASEVLGALFLAAGLPLELVKDVTGVEVKVPEAKLAPDQPVDPFEAPVAPTPVRQSSKGEMTPCWDCGDMKPVDQQKNHSCIECRAARELG